MRNDLFLIPPFDVGDKVIVTMRGKLSLGTISHIYHWKCSSPNGNTMKATVTDPDGNLLMESNPVRPYKFDVENMQVFHEKGDTDIIRIGDKVNLGVLKSIFSKENPLKCEVTLIINKKSTSNGALELETEEIMHTRCSYMKKVNKIIYIFIFIKVFDFFGFHFYIKTKLS